MSAARSTAIAMTIFLIGASATAAPTTFEAKLAIARANGNSKAGAEFDRKLGIALVTKQAQAQMSQCLVDNPGPHSVRGYFEFTTATHFHMIVQPEDRFSHCLVRTTEGHATPKPPRLPYLNPFEFSSTPKTAQPPSAPRRTP